MKKTIGIDLGNTKAVMAHSVVGNTAKVIENHESEQWTPVAVYAEENGEFLVGKLARASGAKQPENMVFSIRRFMGRDYDDPLIKSQIDNHRFPYLIEEGSKGEVLVRLRDRTFSPPEISAMILETLKKDAEDSLGVEVSHAAITVPAYFGNRQKDATRLAGQLAGLNVLRVLSEPSAAVMAYGLNAKNMVEPTTVLVYDLGGETFDATVMHISAGQVMDLGKSGDPFLGGNNFDYCIVKRLVRTIQDQHKLDVRNLPNREANKLFLKYKAEEAKIRLSRANRASITLPGLIRSGGKIIDLEYDLEKAEFNSLILDLVRRSIDLTYDAIKKANTTIADIDHILLVGGSTRVPLVEEELRREFGDKVLRKDINPMLCVAQGAALLTQGVTEDEFTPQADPNIVQCDGCGTLNIKGRADCRKCGHVLPHAGKIFVPENQDQSTQKCQECGQLNPLNGQVCMKCGADLNVDGSLHEKLSHPIGFELDGGGFDIVLNDDLVLPAGPVARLFHTAIDEQRELVLPVYEGNKPIARENQFLGSLKISLPAGLPAQTDVIVSLQVDLNGSLQVTAELPSRPGEKLQAIIDWKSKTIVDLPPAVENNQAIVSDPSTGTADLVLPVVVETPAEQAAETADAVIPATVETPADEVAKTVDPVLPATAEMPVGEAVEPNPPTATDDAVIPVTVETPADEALEPDQAAETADANLPVAAETPADEVAKTVDPVLPATAEMRVDEALEPNPPTATADAVIPVAVEKPADEALEPDQAVEAADANLPVAVGVPAEEVAKTVDLVLPVTAETPVDEAVEPDPPTPTADPVIPVAVGTPADEALELDKAIGIADAVLPVAVEIPEDGIVEPAPVIVVADTILPAIAESPNDEAVESGSTIWQQEAAQIQKKAAALSSIGPGFLAPQLYSSISELSGELEQALVWKDEQNARRITAQLTVQAEHSVFVAVTMLAKLLRECAD